jgi:proline iminopeptidase
MAACVATTLGTALPWRSASSQAEPPSTEASEVRIPVGNTSLFARTIGRGRAVIVLHGGPDFDHSYLLPEFDQLASAPPRSGAR